MKPFPFSHCRLPLAANLTIPTAKTLFLRTRSLEFSSVRRSMLNKEVMGPGINRSTKLMKKRRKKKRIFNNLINYLSSNSYMYQPIVSSQIICSPPPTTTSETTSCFETEKSVRRNKNLVKKIVEYLKSDSFMYATLFSPPPPQHDDEAAVTTSHQAPARPAKRVPTKEVVVTAEITKNFDQPIDKTVNEFGAHELWNDYAFERSSILRRTRFRREPKKRAFHKN